MSDTKFLKVIQLTRSEKIRCLILKTISIFTVMSLISCGKPIENKIKNQSFICTGTVLLDKEIQTCRNQEIKFSMILKEQNISVDYDPCFTNIEFEKLKKDIDNEMKVEFTRKFINPITNHEILHDFVINKVTGEFGIGEQDLQYVGINSLSISGFCKKTNNVVD